MELADYLVEKVTTRCCVAGGGPAGMIAGFLLARAGVDVVVLEKHADFLRDFRGDTIHPSTLELMHELGILDEFLRRPHQEMPQIGAQVGDFAVHVADFSHLPTHCKFIALMPQWDFLNFIAEKAKAYPQFQLRMESEVTELIEENGRIAGVRAKTSRGVLEVRADLTLGTDGRHSIVREKAGLEVIDLGAPIDVLWMRFTRDRSDPDQTLGRLRAGKILVTLNRDDYWQCAYVIPKGVRSDPAGRVAGVSRRHRRRRSFFAWAGGGTERLERYQAVDGRGGSLAPMVAERAVVFGRLGSCDVSGGRGGDQSCDSGCRGGRQYSGAAAVPGQGERFAVERGARASRISDAYDAAASGIRAQTVYSSSVEQGNGDSASAAAVTAFESIPGAAPHSGAGGRGGISAGACADA